MAVPVAGPLPVLLRRLEPLTLGVRQRELVLATRSPWTAYFDNGGQGPDPIGPVAHLCRTKKWEGLAVTCVPNTLASESRVARGRYGAVMFEMFGPEPTEWLNSIRAIAAANDGGRWVFHSSGTLQPFEEPERYTAGRIADRFTAEMLEEYCAALGVRYVDPDFYGPNGLLLEVRHPLATGARLISMTLAEAQERLGISP